MAIDRRAYGDVETQYYGLGAEFGPALCADADDACLDALQAALKAAPCSEDPALCSGLALHKQGDASYQAEHAQDAAQREAFQASWRTSA